MSNLGYRSGLGTIPSRRGYLEASAGERVVASKNLVLVVIGRNDPCGART